MRDGITRVGNRQLSIETCWEPTSLDTRSRLKILDTFERLCSQVWSGRPKNATRSDWETLFQGGAYYHAAAISGECVGFSIRNRLSVDECEVLYGRLTVILPDFQNFGVFKNIMQIDFGSLRKLSQRRALYVSRTRNPVVWFAAADQCERMAIDLVTGDRDEELILIGARLAHVLFPDEEYISETMTSKNIYRESARYITMPQHRNDRLNEAFYKHPAMVTNRDSPLFVGELSRMGHPFEAKESSFWR